MTVGRFGGNLQGWYASIPPILLGLTQSWRREVHIISTATNILIFKIPLVAGLSYMLHHVPHYSEMHKLWPWYKLCLASCWAQPGISVMLSVLLDSCLCLEHGHGEGEHSGLAWRQPMLATGATDWITLKQSHLGNIYWCDKWTKWGRQRDKWSIKGMVHMITMLTYIAQIDIGEYKKTF